MEHRPKKQPKPIFMNNILDDEFHPDAPICQIIPTNPTKKEDCFAAFCPKPKTCLDYNISQTDTKMDAGSTKIHYQHTVAEYVHAEEPPPPPPPKKIKYFSGGPPKWIFIDEIWRKRMVELQKEYYKQFKKRVAARKKHERSLMDAAHRECIAKVGPAWYQELSPKQLHTIDNLKNCIVKDLNEGTIINTQENIGELGLVLRPNHRHIQKALKNCCQCPVEFLLILYQLINPVRTKYSINDRLLLSSVVHLTMMETLKELHIRIPSPPPPPKVVKTQPKKKKIVKYDSPYLEPFSFEKEPRKFTGIYYNKHVQRPQSPYFCYLAELNRMKKAAMEIKDGKQTPRSSLAKSNTKESVSEPEPQPVDEIEEERQIAQQLYEELVDFKPVPVLLKASKYTRCQNFRYQKELEEAAAATEAEEEKEQKQNDLLCYFADDETCCDETEEEVEEKLSGACICSLQNVCPKPKSKCCFEEEPKETDCCGCSTLAKEEQSRLRGGAENNPCGPSSIYENLHGGAHNIRPWEKSAIRSSVCSSRKGEDYASTWTLPGSRSKEPEKKCQHMHDLEIYNKMYHLIRPTRGKERPPCKCREKYRKMLKTPLCQCDKCKADRKSKSIYYIIAGMKETDREKSVPIIDRVVEEKPCTCLREYNKRVKAFEKERKAAARRPCDCRRKTVELAKYPPCPCPQCVEDRRKKDAKFVIAGTKETPEENVRVLDGISMGRPCDCLKKYGQRVDQYEWFSGGQKLVADMKRKDKKFMIGGVANTPEGPMYVVTGMRPPIDCICAKKARQEEAEKRMEAIRPDPIKGRILYENLGVRETKGRNVYVLGSALPIEDCDCMALYQRFTEQHEGCFQLYERYLQQLKDEYNRFMNEMLPPQSRRSSRVSGSINRPSYVEEEGEESEKETPEEAVEETLKEAEEETIVEETKSEIKPKLCQSCRRVVSCRSCYYLPYCSCGNPYYSCCCECGKVQKVECKQCTCGGEVIQCVDCTCGEEEEVVEEEEKKLSRYFIFKKILCKRKWQRNVLKEALKSMADDEFPLAKLPQAYKLPHFKLWMQMRCRKFWTLQDKYNYVWKSKDIWRHTDRCKIWKDPWPKLGITRHDAEFLDWSKADHCRKLANDAIEKFYRKIRQNRINFSREFFPSTFTYEFPFKTWRDCYFAYTPTKEEDVIAKFVWEKYEFKNFSDMKRFCG